MQVVLDSSRDVLRSYGWHYATVAGSRASHEILNRRPDRRPSGVDPEWCRALFSQSPRSNIVVSAEGLSHLVEAEAIARFVQLAKESFDGVTVMFLLRRQDRLAVSHKAQGSLSVAAGDLYGHDNDALPKLTPQVVRYLDFERRVGLWASELGSAEVRVDRYDSASAVGNVLRLLAPADAFGSFDTRMNSRTGAVQSLAGHALKRALGEVNGSVLARSLIPCGTAALLPTRQQASEFYGFFTDGNRRLAHRMRWSEPLFDESFDDYPLDRHKVDPQLVEKAVLEACRASFAQLERAKQRRLFRLIEVGELVDEYALADLRRLLR